MCIYFINYILEFCIPVPTLESDRYSVLAYIPKAQVSLLGLK